MNLNQKIINRIIKKIKEIYNVTEENIHLVHNKPKCALFFVVNKNDYLWLGYDNLEHFYPFLDDIKHC